MSDPTKQEYCTQVWTCKRPKGHDGQHGPEPQEPASPVDVEALKWAMYLGWMAARNPFHERMEFDVWYEAVGVLRTPEIAALRTKEPTDG